MAQRLDDRPRVLVVSRSSVLEDSAAARALAEQERRLSAALQRQVDEVKAALAEEEETLAVERPNLDPAEFEARAQSFRNRVVVERRDAQRKAAALQQVFREARRQLVDALDPILEEIRVDSGADVIVSTESVLAAAPGADVTDAVLAAYDAQVTVPAVRLPPDLADLARPTLPAPAPQD
ncbi:MAG: OmpH family outer membrane protein [Pseudomonadota bacterium]